MNDRINESRHKELEFWKTSDEEKPGVFSVSTILEKSSNAKIFLDSLNKIDGLSFAIISMSLSWGLTMLGIFYSEEFTSKYKNNFY